MKKTNMYKNTTTWNPFKGCLFNCLYCKPSFQRQAKRQKHNCIDCYNYMPHYHLERLKSIPSNNTIFVCGNSDISFCERYEQFLNLDYPRKVLTIEQIMDFDIDFFIDLVTCINPEHVYLGFNSKPGSVTLSEPSMDKFYSFYHALKDAGIEIKMKKAKS